MQSHWSDCAVYNEPAMPNRECDCGGLELPEDAAHTPVVLRVALPGRVGDFLREVHGKGLVQNHHLPADRLVAYAAAPDLIDAHAGVVSGRNTDRMNFDNTLEAIVLKPEADARIEGCKGKIV